jgi:peroxiredoxin
MRKMIIYAFILSMALNSCMNKDGEIKITGKTQGFPDSTKVVLLNFDTKKGVDTTYIVNNKFHCAASSTKVSPHGIFIGEGSEKEFLFLFIEDADISVTGKKGEIKFAKAIGGEIQKQHSDYFNSKLPMELKFDSITKELMKAMQNQDRDKVESLGQQQDDLIQERTSFGALYIKENPDNLYSAFILEGFLAGLPKSEIKTLYENLSPIIKESDYGKSIAQWLELSKEVKVGDIAENFSLQDITGNKVSLKDFLGKFVLLEFWKIGCPGCVEENKNIVTEYEKYKEKGLEIISIAGGKNIDDLKEASDRFFIKWYSLQDSNTEYGNVGSRYGVTLVPTNFLIDPTGRIIAKDLKGKELKDKLKEIF